MAKKQSKPEESRVIENRKARHEYTISDTLECGIVLRGAEVKSVRDGRVQIVDGFVRAKVEPVELTVFGINIEPYGPAGAKPHNAKRARVLLAHKREIRKLARQSEEKGFTLVPLKMYFKDGFAKVLVGVAKGKQAHDKRRAIAERESKRDLDRATSRRAR
jgi:SsrA-binding protein